LRHDVLRHVGTALLILTGVACRQDMHEQPRYTALKASSFFDDNASARPPVAGTVARGDLRDDPALYSGMQNGQPVGAFPFPIDDRIMARGQERFNIHCSPCHGRAGTGDGVVVRRGFSRPPAFDVPRLRSAPVGHFFDVITNGFGVMPDYAAQVKPADRWAIVAYVRALQLAGSATLDDVPPEARGRLGQP
jgi:mono/diheme cytochrome c family protein